jgi:hypothetical protein
MNVKRLLERELARETSTWREPTPVPLCPQKNPTLPDLRSNLGSPW